MLNKIVFIFVLWWVTVDCKIENLTNENDPITEDESGEVYDFSNMGIMWLKANFLNSSTATKLDLSNNNICDIEEGTFDGLPNLKYLNLTGNVFPFWNLNSSNLASLETLDLDQTLSIPYNPFGSDIGKPTLNTIHYLRTTNSGISILLVNTMKLLNLKKLYLRNNKLSRIDLENESLSDLMPKITHMYLSDNNLYSVEFIESLTPTLTHLYLERNAISSLKINDYQNNLQVLSINQNSLGTICSRDEDCNGLSLQKLVTLQNLSISSVGLHILGPHTFDHSSSLVNLDISHNFISEIDNFTFNNLINLKTLLLNGNKLKLMPNVVGLKSLEYLTVSNNKIKYLDKSALNGLSNLKKLNLSLNELTEIFPGTFDELISLEELDLSSNKLQIMPINWISPNIEVQYLYLSDNLFSTFPGLSLSGFKSLKYVSIGNNPLESIVNLRTLMSVTNNTMVDVDVEQIFQLPRLNNPKRNY